MINIISEMLSYSFITRALIVGTLVSLCAALLGTSLVLKRYSMIGDGLSHVGFGALAVAYVMNITPLYVAIPVVLVSAILLLRISENGKIKGDAAIALITTSSLAIGVTAISVSSGMNTEVINYMFGSILTMDSTDVLLGVILSVMVLVLYVIFYTKIFAVTFDENFAKATGTKTGLFNLLIASLTALTVVLGMKMMGAMLISALIIFPSLTSMRLCKTFRGVTLCSALLSLVCFFMGVIISYVYNTPTGASVVIINLLAFAIFSIIGAVRKK